MTTIQNPSKPVLIFPGSDGFPSTIRYNYRQSAVLPGKNQFMRLYAMKINTLSSFVIIGCIGLSPFANADSGKGHNKFLKSFDANNDGIVTMEEFEQSSSDRFKRMDADNNDKITHDEFLSYTKKRRAERQKNKFNRMDTNKDSNISRQEYMDYRMKKAEKKFDRMDKDNNGSVTNNEFATCKSKKHGKFKGKREKRIFHHMDKDNDGIVTKTESHDSWSSWFKRIDANHDNVVTADEIKSYRDNRRSGKE
jgi:Ca2+-binding EF-hand superfamily protein